MVITVGELRSLPSDPREAFVEFEALVRQRCFEEGRYDHNTWNGEAAYIDNIHEFSKRMGFTELAELTREDLLATGAQKEYFDSVRRFVERWAMAAIFDAGLQDRRPDPKTLCLTADVKTQIHAFIGQIREKILEANLPEKKRDSLLSKLADLSLEVDRDRTRLQVFTDFAIDASDGAERVFDQLLPVRRLLDRLYRKLSEAQEEQGRLGKPDEAKRLEDKGDPSEDEFADTEETC